MSTSAPPTPGSSSQRPATFRRVEGFWQRVSEGRDIDVLWSQFAADARSSYGFYGKDVDWDEVNKLPGWKRPFRIAGQLFWAMMNKLTPARRVLLLVALVMLLLSGFQFQVSNQATVEIKFEFLAAILFLLLLSLELADKVIMKRDLEIAREIQTWLVPSAPPAIPNADIAFWTRPQNSVAGDYYDAFYPLQSGTEGGKLMLVMADVAGKSVPAALLMATLQASLRTLASEGAPLSQLAERLNRYASAHSLGGQRFTTAVIAEYDPATRELVYVNAGHNAPVVRHANGGTDRLESSALPFGITADATFPSTTIQLQPGDTLVLFTDGVVEAFNASGEEYSDGRWLNVIRSLPKLSAQGELQHLMKSVEDFVGATRQSDDITCLVLQVQ
jgi:sigma-B regulation protein RsbU (phosphoserine phosphatase)